MEIYTLNVGQGQFVVVTGQSEAIIVDTYLPQATEQDIVFVKGALTKTLAGKKLVGLMITGFDADHFNRIGLELILNKYRPYWIMYPKVFKDTDNAKACFGVINRYDNKNEIARHSVSLGNATNRFYNSLANDFYFELFSPHPEDMNCSNNCSIVCKITENSSGKSYLVTGDTETDRWRTILKTFGLALKSEVMAAPHHGSKNGISIEVMRAVQPHTVLVSAGVNNQFDHPSATAMAIFGAGAKHVFKTNSSPALSLHTVVGKYEVPRTYRFTP